MWERAKVLLIGAILAQGERTVTAILRVMDYSMSESSKTITAGVVRANWSSRALSRLLLQALDRIFVPENAPIIVGIDVTFERQRGAEIAPKGISCDPVRASKDFFVKTSGQRSRFDDVARANPVGSTGVGFAFFRRVYSLRAL